jgi:hypothetical protein
MLIQGKEHELTGYEDEWLTGSFARSHFSIGFPLVRCSLVMSEFVKRVVIFSITHCSTLLVCLKAKSLVALHFFHVSTCARGKDFKKAPHLRELLHA